MAGKLTPKAPKAPKTTPPKTTPPKSAPDKTKDAANTAGGQGDAKNHANKKTRKKGGSTTNPNTGPFYYLSKGNDDGSCNKERKAVEEHCDTKNPKKSAPPESKLAAKKAFIGFAEKAKAVVTKLDDRAKTLYGYENNITEQNKWVGQYCSGLWVKPLGGEDPSNIEKFKAQLEAVKQGYLNDATELAKKMGWSIVQKVEDRAIQYGQTVVEEEAGAAVSLLVPGVGEVVEAGTQVWVALTGVWTAVSTAYSVAKFAVTEGPKILAQIKNLAAEADEIKKVLTDGTSMNNLMADAMTAIAELNSCVRARKCSLIPYKDTATADGQAKSGVGCCPGQTGHHLMPDTMFREPPEPPPPAPDGAPKAKKPKVARKNKKTLKCWEKYDVDAAPVLCVEGASNNAGNGSHGLAHSLTDKILEQQKEWGPDGKVKPISYTHARDEMATMVEVLYGCSKQCIAAQLDAYYKDAYSCDKGGPPHGGEVMPFSGASGEKTSAPSISTPTRKTK